MVYEVADIAVEEVSHVDDGIDDGEGTFTVVFIEVAFVDTEVECTEDEGIAFFLAEIVESFPEFD